MWDGLAGTSPGMSDAHDENRVEDEIGHGQYGPGAFDEPTGSFARVASTTSPSYRITGVLQQWRFFGLTGSNSGFRSGLGTYASRYPANASVDGMIAGSR